MEWKKLDGNKIQIGMAVVGVVMIGVGVWQMVKVSKGNEVEMIEVEKVEEVEQAMEIVVDVQGAVEAPGVYRLSGDVRIADVLVVAGGLSVSANRSYVARFINQAERVDDGMKIYIPAENEPMSNEGQVGGHGLITNNGSVAGSGVVNVNSASLSELDSLWGIGEARADSIIANRPYESLDELVTKANVPQNVLDNNEGKMVVK